MSLPARSRRDCVGRSCFFHLSLWAVSRCSIQSVHLTPSPLTFHRSFDDTFLRALKRIFTKSQRRHTSPQMRSLSTIESSSLYSRTASHYERMQLSNRLNPKGMGSQM